jgi:hypothetical protein
VGLTDHLAALERLQDVADEQVRDVRRNELNAKMRAEAVRDPDAVRKFLSGLDVCQPEQAFRAMAIVEALAGASDSMDLLGWYFDLVARAVVPCAGIETATQVLTTYAFLEHGEGKRKFEFLPRYIALARSEVTELRRAALDLLSGFEIASAPGVRDAVVRLLTDGDWRIRRDAESLLREQSVLPSGYKPSFGDRMRRLFGS